MRKLKNKKFNIFIAYHIPFYLMDNEILTPIHAGRAYAKYNKHLYPQDFKWCLENLIGDDTGDNISHKNKHYCETTITYWIWKNIVSKYVGLLHYRRILNLAEKPDFSLPFSYKNYGYTEKNLEKLMSEYDIILPYKSRLDLTIYDHYVKDHLKYDIDYTLDYLYKTSPEIVEIAEKCLHGHTGYFCNICITKKEIFNEYSKWLFDILFNMEEHLKNNIYRRDNYQQRIYGFLAERYSSIYFHYLQEKKNIKYKEVPTMFIDDEHKFFNYINSNEE